MTLKEAKATLKPLGITITSRPHTKEYRVNFLGGKEATAYYATDLQEAVGTGQHMATQDRVLQCCSHSYCTYYTGDPSGLCPAHKMQTVTAQVSNQ